ncbi:MAG: hypothetical protein MO852_16260, partial [Candidatus Devosia euplotis]|nr:hypothetical protein [Candidatus Devosia euplotis]
RMLNMPTLALLAWFPFVFYFFHSRKGRSSVARTTAWAIMIGILVLPSRFTIYLPLAPLGKMRAISMGVYLCLLTYHGGFWRARSKRRRIEVLFLLWCIAAPTTVLMNLDPLPFTEATIRAHTVGDIPRQVVSAMWTWYLPFLIGYRVFRTPKDLRHIMSVIVLGAAIYVLPILAEVRLSPQFHTWVYGFRPFDWVQARREGGFRPNVMMVHGLACALFLFEAITAAGSLAKSRRRLLGRFKAAHLQLVLFVTLILCKSKGALVFAVCSSAMLLFGSMGLRRWAAMIIVSIAMLYPVLRGYEIFPANDIVEFIEGIDPDRAQSLGFRFFHEEQLMNRAFERPVFGWGEYSRWRVRDEAGRDISVTDGTWVIMLGRGGIVLYVLVFSMFWIPVYAAFKKLKTLRTRDAHMLSGLALMVAFHAADLLPNSLMDLLPLVWAGALMSISTHWPKP